jgi:predicted transposase YbfD/YdcC
MLCIDHSLAHTAFSRCFGHLKDPRRVKGRIWHPFPELLVIAILAVIAGADSWQEIADFAQMQREWLVRWLRLERGVPSADTFWRVLTLVDPKAFFQSYTAFTEHLRNQRSGEVIAWDGKTVRGSQDSPLGVLHVVRAWATEQRLVLAQQASEAKSHEQAALLSLIETLDLQGTVSTIDAAGCYVPIAEGIVRQQGDYAIAVKANQRTLYEEIALRFLPASHGEIDAETKVETTVEQGHGRRETRTLWAAPAASVDVATAWPKAQSIMAQRRVREVEETRSEEWRYFISTLPAEDPKRLSEVVRAHWLIENPLHWVLDVAFHEDQSQLQIRRGQQNFATLRTWALTLIQRAPRRAGVARTRKMAAWNPRVLEAILLGETIAN